MTGPPFISPEHHIDNFDAGAFFSLHDFDSSGFWDAPEISKFYGLNDESLASVPHSRKAEVVRSVMQLFDPAQTGRITRDEWLRLSAAGVRLPDFGLGPGHHGDDEYEYEIHHFEKFHDENTKEEDLIHEEDKAHFRKHEEMEAEEERIMMEQQKPIVEANIPIMFRKGS
ncbi:MAG: hypothetical protein Q9160_000669 [Pyrenula sp. 1 TL-2023]